jgi:hypothetical protein
MQIKTTVRYHFTIVRMAVIKKKKKTGISEDVKGTLAHGRWGMQINTAIMANSMDVPQKIKN